MSFTGTENHEITLQEAADLTANYRSLQTGTSFVKGAYYSKAALMSILDQRDCVGIRIYYGVDGTTSKPQLVLVGADANTDDIVTGVILDKGTMCPPTCGATNALNS